jgi:hypothetical protein
VPIALPCCGLFLGSPGLRKHTKTVACIIPHTLAACEYNGKMNTIGMARGWRASHCEAR